MTGGEAARGEALPGALRPPLSHAKAVWAMLAATLLWSIAGVVTLRLESARSFEVTFWRSFFNALALLVLLPLWLGPAALWRALGQGGRTLWLSGACWSVMFTAFMLALTLTTVANVLVTMAIAPLLTALMARFALRTSLPARTWAAVVVAGIGIAWMYAGGAHAGTPTHWLGTAVALAVPVAAAINWTVIQRSRSGADHNLLPAVLIGALLSSLMSLPLALPFAGSAHDVTWLALLGVAQLAVPCLLAVAAARSLSAPEVSLLGLLEIVFGVAWAWLAGREQPRAEVLVGGLVVLVALVANGVFGLRDRASRAGPTGLPMP